MVLFSQLLFWGPKSGGRPVIPMMDGRFPFRQNFLQVSFWTIREEVERKIRLPVNNAYWLEMAGKYYRCQPLAETELRKFREFLFQPVRTEKLEYLTPPEVRPFVLKTILWNRVFNLHLNRSNWKFCLNGKRPSIIGITWRPPDFGPQNSSWENNTIFISLITSIDTV